MASESMSERRGILYGMPVRITDDSCEPANWLAGLVLTAAIALLGFNGNVLEYEPGGYLRALWAWCRGDASGN
jgi:hypothetical protein